MKACSTCKETTKNCMTSHSFAFAHLYSDEKIMDMHIHDCYEIYYSISGGKQFLIDDCFYDIHPGDVFLINQYETHHLTQINQQTHERIILSIDPDYLTRLSSTLTNLNLCFEFHDTHMPHCLHLTPNEQKRFIYFLHQFENNSGLGEDLLDKAVFIELMVFLNRIYENSSKNTSPLHNQTFASQYHKQIDSVLSYINSHISEPLTLEDLSNHFYMSTSYLCRTFKAATGTTINKYITAKRITLSKSLLNQGYSVTEAYEACGFNDYSNYLKAFTKAVGISPKKYAQFNS